MQANEQRDKCQIDNPRCEKLYVGEMRVFTLLANLSFSQHITDIIVERDIYWAWPVLFLELSIFVDNNQEKKKEIYLKKY